MCIFGAERTCRRVARQFTTPATRTNWSAMGTGQNSSDNLSWQVREKCCGSHDFQWASIEFDQLVYQPVDVFISFRGTVSVATRQLNFLIELGIYHMGRFQDWVCTKKGWLPEGKFLRVQGLSSLIILDHPWSSCILWNLDADWNWRMTPITSQRIPSISSSYPLTSPISVGQILTLLDNNSHKSHFFGLNHC